LREDVDWRIIFSNAVKAYNKFIVADIFFSSF